MSGVPKRLALSAAMCALLARDDPPTEVSDQYLARLVGAGVEMIEAMLRELPDNQVEFAENADEAAEAIAIFVAGPGLLYTEALNNERAPAHDALANVLFHVERFDKLRRFRLASDDMRLVEETARQLLDRDGPARLFEQMLETALVVTYSRPYLDSNKAGIGERWSPKDEADRDFHRYVIDELRDPLHAHMERTRRRTLVDTTRFLGLDGPPTYAQGRWFMTQDELERLAELARKQGELLETEANRIGAELGEEREGPRPQALFVKQPLSGDVDPN
jgi:hypothetical protein